VNSELLFTILHVHAVCTLCAYVWRQCVLAGRTSNGLSWFLVWGRTTTLYYNSASKPSLYRHSAVLYDTVGRYSIAMTVQCMFMLWLPYGVITVIITIITAIQFQHLSHSRRSTNHSRAYYFQPRRTGTRICDAVPHSLALLPVPFRNLNFYKYHNKAGRGFR